LLYACRKNKAQTNEKTNHENKINLCVAVFAAIIGVVCKKQMPRPGNLPAMPGQFRQPILSAPQTIKVFCLNTKQTTYVDWPGR
jgi:hypothetical protein